MVKERPFLRLFDYAGLKRLFLVILGLSLIPIAETSLYYWAFDLFSVEIVVAVTAATGFIGFFYLSLRVRRLVKHINRKIEAGEFDEQRIVRLLGVLSGGLLLLLPGFITDALGIVILFSFLKRICGRVLLHLFRERIMIAYEYLKLS